MESAGLSPSPWHADPAFDHQVVLGADGILVADCSIHHRRRSIDENRANARLISAAPEMAAAIEDALVNALDIDGSDRISISREHFDDLNSALRKARGA